MKNLIYWVVTLVIFLLGIGTLYVAETLPDENKFQIAILNKAATTFLVSGLLAFLNRVFLERNLIDLILSKTNLKRSIDDTGIVDVKTNINDVDYHSLFNSVNKIDIAHVYGRTWTSTYEDKIVKALSSGTKIRVLVCDKDSPFVKGLAFQYESDETKLAERIDDVLGTWKNIRAKVKTRKARKNLQVFRSCMLPSFSLYRFNDKVVIVMNRLSKTGKTKNLNVLTCEKNESEKSMFNNCMEDLENLIESSSEIIFE